RRVFDYPVDDGAALIGRFRGGALAQMNVAYNCPDTYPRRTLELIGTEAMAVARNTMGQTPGGTLRLIAAADGGVSEVSVPAEEDVSPFRTQVETFSACLLAGVPFPFPPERDLHTMRLLEAAQRGAGGIVVGAPEHEGRRSRLRQAEGMWKNRDDLPDSRELRGEWDRFEP
ncbi:MAG: hypothetical protein M3Q65_05465, partial [Chloroflexota bacterium]|nr:hypothetical protein [Chloroflexota bacterium]